jgi:tetratricopeptide (TPR) repeat protein
MTALSQVLLNRASHGRMLTDQEVSSFSAFEIRQAIADLVKQGKMGLAEALSEAGLTLYPESPDILSISALLAEVRQDWSCAATLLEQFVQLQGDDTPVITWHHWIRVLRNKSDIAKAMEVARKALELYPDESVLQTEVEGLTGLLEHANRSIFATAIQ